MAQVWLVEDNKSYRTVLAKVLNQIDGFTCSATFASCEEALAFSSADGQQPDVILLDVELPGISGIEGIVLLKQKWPSSKIIMLTVHDDQDKVFSAICAGANGYLLKTSSESRIAEAITQGLLGGSPIDAQVARQVLEMFARLAKPHSDYHLTERERETLECLVEGLTKKEIANRMGVSYHTIDFHLRHIYEKLHVNNRTGAVAKALNERLHEKDPTRFPGGI